MSRINLDYLALGLLPICIGFLWYTFWIQPRTEFLMQIADCMPDESQESYNYCFEKIKAEQGR